MENSRRRTQFIGLSNIMNAINRFHIKNVSVVANFGLQNISNVPAGQQSLSLGADFQKLTNDARKLSFTQIPQHAQTGVLQKYRNFKGLLKGIR